MIAAKKLLKVAVLGVLAALGCKRDELDPTLATARPESDIARDVHRKPQQVLDFFEIRPGHRVVELMASAGYYVDQLSRRVGPSGRVYAQNAPWVLNFAGKRLTLRLTNPELSNVERIDAELEAMPLPTDLDAVVMILFYHDMFWMGTDRKLVNAKVFEALKPGGIYGVIDHRAKAGAGTSVVKTLHRVEEADVRREIEAAGFELVATSDLLKRTDDPMDYDVLNPPDGRERDTSDQFVLKFRKPVGAPTPSGPLVGNPTTGSAPTSAAPMGTP